MRRSILIAALVCLAFLAGICFTFSGSEAPERVERTVRTNVARAPGNAPAHATAIPPAANTGAPARDLPHADNAPAGRLPPVDPAGAEVRKLVREAVALRKQRDWARLRALQERMAALSHRDINILLHLLKSEADVESALMIGDLLARQADDAERAAWIRAAAPALARTFRRLIEGDDAGASAEERARAVEHLARFANADDVEFLLGVLQDPARGPLRQSTGIALGRAGDPALCLAPARAAAERTADLSTQAVLAIAVDGLARRAGADGVREWLRTRLVPDMQHGIGAATDTVVRSEALAAIAMVTEQSLTATLLATVESNSDPAARRSLVALLPEVASADEVEMLRARLGKDEAIHAELEAALTKLMERAGNH